MKKGFILVLSLLLLSACGEEESKEVESKKEISQKGHWSAEDKAKADKAIAEIEDDLSVFGDNKESFIECYLEKLENNYSSFSAADSDIPGAQKVARECASEVLGSNNMLN